MCLRTRSIRIATPLLIAAGLLYPSRSPKAFPAQEPQAIAPSPPVRRGHPKLDSQLYELGEEYAEKSRGHAFRHAEAYGMKTDAQDRVKVFLLAEPGETVAAIDRRTLTSYGVEVIKGTDRILQAWVPIFRLRQIAEVAGIGHICLPDQPVVQNTSEGVSLTRASIYQSSSKGKNVKVAIIDLGFAGLLDALSHGDIPGNFYPLDCTGSSCVASNFANETEKHGTAVAEIVYDMAPEAELYLIKVADSVDLKHAVDILKSLEHPEAASGVKVIINHSVAWFNTNFYDGTCLDDNPVCTTNTAYANQILWVNAAGNHAQAHYAGTFSDTDNNGWHEFSAGDETIAVTASSGDTIAFQITWDAWPATDQDYDVYLYDSSQNIKARSENLQTGSQRPTEQISYKVSGYWFSETFHLAIYKRKTTRNHKLVVYNLSNRPDGSALAMESRHVVPEGSVISPADSARALAVAAINVNRWASGPQETFSCQGPTNGGLIKPDISGPDNVSNYTYTWFWFFGSFGGTSAAAPHVAGAAALIASKNPNYNVSALWKALTDSAILMGGTAPNNTYGYGRLNLPFITDWVSQPPSTLISGQTYTVSWRVTEGNSVAHTNLHYSTDRDPLTNATYTTSVQSGAPGVFSATFTAPSVTSATTFYFVPHARITGSDGSQTNSYSNIEWRTVTPAAVTRTLTVASANPSSGVSVAVNPADKNGQSTGTTQFTRTYDNSTLVSVAAPLTAGANTFQKWQRDGADWSTSASTNVTMDADHMVTAVYAAPATCTDPYEPNDSSSTASPLVSGSSYAGKICTGADVDWFRATITSPGTLSFSLTVPAGKDYDLEFYGPSGSYIKGSYNSAGVSESLTYQASVTGTYYVRVYAYQGLAFDTANPYTLTYGFSSGETVFTPTAPSGSSSGYTGSSYTYSTGGSASSQGGAVQYIFYWGDGTNSGWLATGTTTASKSWASAGSYSVTAQARSAGNTSVVSAQSGSLSVTITTPVTEAVSIPNSPSGPGSGTTATSYTYLTGGAASTLGNPVQYLFYWGDGTNSGWLAVGTTQASKSWASAGTYLVTAQARSAANTAIVSAQSAPLAVTIAAPVTESVSTPSRPSGPATGNVGSSYTYSTAGPASSLGNPVQYIFTWGDGTNSGWLPTGTTQASKTWSAPGSYQVTARARSAVNPSVVSEQSSSLTVAQTGTAAGAGVRTFSSFSDVSGAAAQVHDLGVDSSGNVYVLFPLSGGLAVVKSTDGGGSFGSPVSIPNSAYSNFEYRLAVDPSNVLHVVWWLSSASGTETFYSRSTDGGAGFSSPIRVRTGNAYNGYRTDNAVEPVVASDGTGNVYVAYGAYTRDSSGNFIGYNIWVSKSTNGGASFLPEFCITTPSSTQKTPVSIQATASAFYVLFRDTTNSDLYFHHGSPSAILNNATRVNPNGGKASYGGSLAADPNGTTLYSVFSDTTTDYEGDIRFCRSTDSGATWGNCVTVNDNSYRWQAGPALALDRFGTLHVVWTDLRSNAKYQTYYAYSTNGGLSFSPNLNVSAGQTGADFTQAHLAVDGPRSLLYVSSTRNVNQVVLSRGSFAAPSVDLRLVKSHSGSFTVGLNGSYDLTVTNLGPESTSQPIALVDTLPAGLSYVSAGGVGWDCNVSAQTVTCTNLGPLAPNASTSVALTVGVGGAAAPSVTNTATVTTAGDTNTSNNTASDITAVSTQPAVAITGLTPSVVSIAQGGTAETLVVTLARASFSGAVTLAVSGQPSGVTANITQPGAGNTGSISFQAASNAMVTSGTSVTVTASGTGISPVTASFTLVVRQGGGTGVRSFTPFANVTGAAAQVHGMGVDSSGNVYILFPLSGGLAVVKSTDGGASFGSPVSIPNSGYSNFEYHLAVDPSNVLHVVWWLSSASGTETFYSKSTDGGASFSSPIRVRTGNAYNGYRTDNAIEPVVASDGTGSVYVAYSAFTRDSSNVFVGYNIWVSKSTNGGVSFQPEFYTSTPTSPQKMPWWILATTSAFYILFKDETNYDLYFHRGSASSVLNNASRINPTSGKAMYGGDIAVDANGAIYAAISDTTSDYEGDVYVCKSTDVGATWGNYVRVNDSTYRYQESPVLAVDRFGTLHVVWTDLRSNSKYQIYYAYSTNGGASFSSPNTNLSSDQPDSNFSQAHLAADNPRSLLYVSASKDYSQVVTSRGSFASLPDVAIAMTHSGSFTVGTNGTYTITVSNTGSASTSGTITVADTLPTGLAFISASGTGWNCSASGQSVTCTNPGPIAPGGSANITLTVGVDSAAVPAVTNTATVMNAGDANPANNSASDPTTVALPPNPVPSLSSLAPSTALAGGPAFTLTVSGAHFISGAVLRWNGTDRTTSYLGSTQLTASIPASDVAVAGAAQITVFNPAPGGGSSNALTFTINSSNPTPSLGSLSPSSAVAGGAALNLTVNGLNFVSGAVVQWGASNRMTTFISDSQLNASISAADIATAGLVRVAVVNPAPGGGLSNALDFTVYPVDSRLSAGNAQALPGSSARIPIFVSLASGKAVDTLAFGLKVSVTGAAPALTGALAFNKDASLPPPSQIDAAASPNVISVSWFGLATPLVGTIKLGEVLVNIPATAADGQAYTVQVTGASGGLAEGNVALLAGPDARLTVAARAYLVGDVFPVASSSGDLNGDGDKLDAGEFGDDSLTILDLIYGLRAVTSVPGYRPPACSDRFDAIDSFPKDTDTARGGDGILNTVDLIYTLRRVTNVDTSRPRRTSRGLACPAQAPGQETEAMQLRRPIRSAARAPAADLQAETVLQLGTPQPTEGGIRVGVYLHAAPELNLAGFSFAAGLAERGPAASLRFVAADAGSPSLIDGDLPGVVAVAWLDGLRLPAGRPVLLGYLEMPAGQANASLQFYGASANTSDGGEIRLTLSAPPSGHTSR